MVPVVGPAEVHPEEHLGPVRRFRAAGAGADRQDRRVLVVLAREEELGPLPVEVVLEGRAIAVTLGGELRITRFLDELAERLELRGPFEQTAPPCDVGPEAVSLAEDALRDALVVPEAGCAGQCLELGEPSRPCGEVKDAPRSTGSARPGRGRRQRPSVSDLEILEQDRTELDEAEGRLAPGDDGVHAGTVAVVGADAAVAVAIEGGRVAARSAVAFTGDQIDEGRFLNLLHDSLFPYGRRHRAWRGDVLEVHAGGACGGFGEYRWPTRLRQEGKRCPRA
jgi:hypothetical protein